MDRKYRIAVASTDGIVINEHFGKASSFLIIDIENNEYKIVEERAVTPVCQSHSHDLSLIEETANKISDCSYLLVSRIGDGAFHTLEKHHIIALELPGLIEESIQQFISFKAVQDLFA